MNRIYGLLLGALIMAGAAGCGTEAQLEAAEPEPFTSASEQDLSDYIITEEEEDEEEHVPYNEDWNYITTLELMRVLDGQETTSQDRSSYDEVPPEWNGVALIDSRPREVFAAGHINGAVNIPDSEFDSFTDMLPEDKETMLIFYCGGLHCPLSGNSAEKAMELGYDNSYVYQEGTPAWKKAGNYFTVDESYVEEKIMESYVAREDTKPVLLIDTRTYEGYFNEHIPTAVFWEDTQYGVKYAGFAPENKEAEIIVYCGGFFCHKSHELAESLLGDGYTNVKVFAGGMPAWKQAALPVFGMESGGEDFDVSAGKVDRSVSSDEFDDLVQKGSTVIDVRGESETASGMIDNAIHIPDGDIHANDPGVEENLPEDKNDTLVIHCASGARAAGVVEKIADLGYEEVYYLNGPISISSDGSYSLD